MKLLHAAAFLAFQFALASPASALEAQPGDACPVVGRYIFSGGPELSGVTHQMVCNASNVWSSVLDNDAAGNVALVNAVSLTGDISPAQITANQNDYSPAGLSTASVLRLNSDASRNITSLAGGTDGRILAVMNIGSFPIVLKNDDGATGTAANRFALTGDLSLAAKQSAILMYDSTASRWRQVANVGTATGGSGAIDDLTDAFADYATNHNIIGGRAGAAALTSGAQFNTFWGEGAGATTANSTAATDGNSAFGYNALSGLASGALNTAVGASALASTAAGVGNTAVGNWALIVNVDDSNTAIGEGALQSSVTGSDNVALGGQAGQNLTSGDKNIVIGDNIDLPSATGSYQLNIGNIIYGTAINGSGGTLSTGNIGIGTKAPGAKFDNAGSTAFSGDISPAQITADQNNYNPAGLSTASVLRLNSDASRNITSLAGGADGRLITLMNIGSFPIVLKNDDGATGTAANRFALTGDLTLAAKQSAMLMYDSTASRWRQIANGTATGAGDNLGNHIATANIQLGSYWLSGDGGNEGLFVENDGNGGLVSNNGNAAFIITSPLSDANTAIALRSRGSGMDREAAVWADQAGALHLKTNTFGDAILFDDGNGTSVGAFTSTRFENKVATLISGDISPAQITANQNNYNPANLAKASVLRLTSDASRTITGLAGGADGRVVTILNVGSNPIVLKNDDGSSSTAANRFALTGDLTLAAKQSAMLMYDSTASRWRQIANGTATGSGDNLGNHTATANVQLGSYWLSGDGGNEGLKIDSTGHITVGPGTDASQEAVVPWLYVNTTSDGGISVRDSTANAEQVMVLWGGVAYLGPVTNTPLAFQTNDTERMRIVESGNVGIGTATPADSLHVYEATPGESAGITIGNDGTGVSQQSWLNLVTKGDGSHPLGTAGVQGWQIWANADASTTLGYTGGANGLGIGYTDGSSWNNVALVIQPTDRLGIFNPFPGAGLDAGTSVALSGDISPAQITADKNNYNPTDLAKASVLRLTSDASRTITGIAGGVDGRVLTILNVGSNPIVLSNQNTSSTAANRFAIGANFTISADQSASLIYDSTSQRWRSASLPFSAPTCSVYSYSFPAIASQPASTLVPSPIIPIATNSCTATVSISGAGSPQFRICSDAACATVVNDWGSAGQSISNAQYIQARLTTSAVNATDTATLSVGSTLGNFSVDTAVTYKLIFITSALYSGNLGGVSGADAKCASAATAAGLSGTYLAWIADSTDASTPATRFTQASVPYRRKDLTKVANNWTGLTSGTLLADLNMDENGTPSSISSGNYSGQKPFHSNVNANGTRVGTTACTDWTSTSGNGLVGDAKQSGSTWSNATTQACNAFATMHVLCVQQ